MGFFKGFLNFIVSPSEQNKFIKNVKNAIVNKISKKVITKKREIKIDIEKEVEFLLRNNEEVHELTYGDLRYALGLRPEEVENVINALPNIIAESITIHTYNQGENVGIKVIMTPLKYDKILAIPDATFIQYNSRNPGSEIHWLEWLLLKGDSILVSDYWVKYQSSPNSRSGGAWMIANGGGFRIDPRFSGISTNNFITRALEHLDTYLFNKINKIAKE